MRIVVFGASGGTGRALVAQAVAQGHEVTAFVRNPARLGVADQRVSVAQGDVVEAASVHHAVEGQDAVVCVLGAATPLRRNPRLVRGVQHIITAMQASSVRRLVYLSYVGVGEGRHQLGAFGRLVVAQVLLRKVVADHEAKEQLIKHSGLDWVIVRPPRLTNGPLTRRYRHGVDILAASVAPRISRADVADFMLEQLTGATYKCGGLLRSLIETVMFTIEQIE